MLPNVNRLKLPFGKGGLVKVRQSYISFLHALCKRIGADCKTKLTTVCLIGTVSSARAYRMQAAQFCEGNNGQTVTAKLIANTSRRQ